MSIFGRKKFPPIEEITVPDEWTVYQGRYQSKLLIARFRKEALKIAGHPSLAHQVGIAAPLTEPDANGFPSGEETEALGRIEQLIGDALEPKNESILVAVISTNGMREFVLYTSNPEAVRSKVQDLVKQVSTHALQLMIRPDREWRVLKSLMK